jgi:hypothetical protein
MKYLFKNLIMPVIPGDFISGEVNYEGMKITIDKISSVSIY